MTRLLLIVLLASCGGGQSIGPGACDHVQSGSKCCTLTTDCEAGLESCAPPGVEFACGICNMEPETCASDAACKAQGATLICQVRTCACDGERDCVPGCTSNSGCDEGQTCNLATNRCAPTTCTTDPDCPLDFSCSGVMCLRKACSSSGDCDAFCVEGQCYQSAGECRPPSA